MNNPTSDTKGLGFEAAGLLPEAGFQRGSPRNK